MLPYIYIVEIVLNIIDERSWQKCWGAWPKLNLLLFEVRLPHTNCWNVSRRSLSYRVIQWISTPPQKRLFNVGESAKTASSGWFKIRRIANIGLLYKRLPLLLSSKYLKVCLPNLVLLFGGNQWLYFGFFNVFLVNFSNLVLRLSSIVLNPDICSKVW